MKKIFQYALSLALILCLFSLTACGSSGSSGEDKPQTDSPAQTENLEPQESGAETKELVVYFSATGNTRTAAEALADKRGADLVEITAEEPYTDEDLNYNDSASRATIEQNDADARPAISATIENIEDYDVIYIGFPIWWGGLPKILYTFFDTYDLAGKTIAPFCTSGGSGISGAASEITELEPSAIVTEGLRTTASAAEDDFDGWLDSIGLA